MEKHQLAKRRLFIEPFLVTPQAACGAVPDGWYDEARDLTLSPGGEPLVEAAGISAVGTDTAVWGAPDTDDDGGDGAFHGTMTSTAVKGESTDDDATSAWAMTPRDTRGRGRSITPD